MKVGDGPNTNITDIAECRLNLGPLLPWNAGAGENAYRHQEAADVFTEMTEAERTFHVTEMRKSELALRGRAASNIIEPPKKAEEDVDSSGVHILMRRNKDVAEKFPLKTASLNMKLGHGHGRPGERDFANGGNNATLQGGGGAGVADKKAAPGALKVEDIVGGEKHEEDKSMRDKSDIFLRATGEVIRGGGGAGGTRGDVEGRLEDSQTSPFVNDFFFKSLPLTRNRDVVTSTDMEPSYDPGIFGFIKCAIKLTEGHLDEVLGENFHFPAGSAQSSSSRRRDGDDTSTPGPSSSSSASSGAEDISVGVVAVAGGAAAGKNPQEGGAAGEGDTSPVSPGGKHIDPVSGRKQSAGISPVLDAFAWDEELMRERYN